MCFGEVQCSISIALKVHCYWSANVNLIAKLFKTIYHLSLRCLFCWHTKFDANLKRFYPATNRTIPWPHLLCAKRSLLVTGKGREARGAKEGGFQRAHKRELISGYEALMHRAPLLCVWVCLAAVARMARSKSGRRRGNGRRLWQDGPLLEGITVRRESDPVKKRSKGEVPVVVILPHPQSCTETLTGLYVCVFQDLELES